MIVHEVQTYIGKRCPEVFCFGIPEVVVFQIFLVKEEKQKTTFITQLLNTIKINPLFNSSNSL